MSLFIELTEKQQEILKERNAALDFMDGVHPENKELITALVNYIASKNAELNNDPV